jgi:LmbE family N-acetylglucosaminyl deacetylase
MSALPAVRSALAVCAHPDDESFGLGAVLSTLDEAGSKVSALSFTHGEASTLHAGGGDLATIRAAEMVDAGDVLGLSHVELLDYPDGALSTVALDSLAAHVHHLARMAEADLLLVFDDGGITGHADHQRATDAAMASASRLGLPVLAWALPLRVAARLNREFATSFVGRHHHELDFSIAIDRGRQLEAISRHHSQSTDNPVLWRRLDLLGPAEHLRYLT